MRPSPFNTGASNSDPGVTCINTAFYQYLINAPDITTVDEKGSTYKKLILSSYRAFDITLNISFNLFLETPRVATVQKGAMSYERDHTKKVPATLSPHDNRGVFEGGSYSVTHRDTNAVLNIELQQGITVRSRSGAMIHMSGSVALSGKSKFSFGKLFTGGQIFESEYDGPGSIALGPTLFGDIVPLHIHGPQWIIGKDAFLACTSEVTKKREVQGLGKAMFSGEDLFVYRIEGHGILWLTSFGAVDRLNLRLGDEHIVDNGHLVAWNCEYSVEKAGGGTMTGLKTGEGLVCRFKGPGSVFVQTRNMADFQLFIRAIAAGTV